jgi:hypothetical protein
MNLNYALLLMVFILLALSACRPVILSQQQATAIAFVQSEETIGRQAAENAAMALCNVDFTRGQQSYQLQVCAQSTQMGCRILTLQIGETWKNFKLSYPVPRLVCEIRSSQLLEESRQFNLSVQYWQVKLRGTEGWPQPTADREYWLQVARENGNWKLNRVLVLDEVRYYAALQSDSGNG